MYGGNGVGEGDAVRWGSSGKTGSLAGEGKEQNINCYLSDINEERYKELRYR